MRKRLSPNKPFWEYDKKRLDEKISVVCKTCNNGWMSDLTGELKKGFSDLIVSASPLSILPNGIPILSAYTFLKAVVADHTQLNSDEPFFSLAARERFRASLAVPANVQIWIAAFRGKHRHSGRFVSGLLIPDPGPLSGVEFFTFTYVVGHLVLQLVASRWKDVRFRGRIPLMLKPNVYWEPAALRIAPYDGFPISWPPPKYLGDNVIDTFVYRFNVPINVPAA
jgi:hypothetical protein